MSGKPQDEKQALDRELDFELEETFPASDPLDITQPQPHRKTGRVVMIVTFPWDAPEGEVHAQSIAQARELAQRGGFLSKTILRDAATKTSGAVYVFADRSAAERWREDLRQRRGSDVDARIFDVNEEASKLGRG